MANYTAYIPKVGSITYPTQLGNFISISEAIDTELENARGSEITVLDHINTKLSLVGGTMTGTITNFTSTGIDDNATSGQIEIKDNVVVFGGTTALPWDVTSGTDHMQLSNAVGMRSVNNSLAITSNAYRTETQWEYAATDRANRFLISPGGGFGFDVAVSGSVGTTITWINAFDILPDTGNATFGGNVSLADNKHLYLGNSDDLDIYHSGADSFLDNHIGNFSMRNRTDSGFTYFDNDDSGGTSRRCISLGGAIPKFTAYYNGSQKLNTTTAGISIGVNDNTAGVIDIYGGPTATTEGGQISLYTCVDHDSTVDYFYMDVNEARLRFGGAGVGIALQIDSSKNVVVSDAILATTATDGFLYIPTCAGTPTGGPTSWPGRAPIVYDSTNNKLYIYDGGWLATAALT